MIYDRMREIAIRGESFLSFDTKKLKKWSFVFPSVHTFSYSARIVYNTIRLIEKQCRYSKSSLNSEGFRPTTKKCLKNIDREQRIRTICEFGGIESGIFNCLDGCSDFDIFPGTCFRQMWNDRNFCFTFSGGNWMEFEIT